MRKMLFKSLFAFFLFRIRRYGIQNTTVLCRPGDTYHWWKWLSRKVAAAETAKVMPGYWGHNYVPGKEVWTDCLKSVKLSKCDLFFFSPVVKATPPTHSRPVH